MINCKICNTCNKEIPISEFNRNSKAADGRQGYCKVCQSEKRRAYYKDNKDKEYETLKSWRSRNQEKHRATNKKWRENNPEKYEAHWRRHNKEYKLRVLLKVGNGEIRCLNCGCDRIEFLEVNHKNGGGAKEVKHNNKKFYSLILSGERDIEDLEILCKPCNNLHYLELKYGPQPYKIYWEGIKND
jgi:hypothetical protein